MAAISEILAAMAPEGWEAEFARRRGFSSIEELDAFEERRLAQEAEERRRADEERRRAYEEAHRPEKLLEAGGYTRAASPVDFDTLCKAVEEARRRGCGLLFTGGV